MPKTPPRTTSHIEQHPHPSPAREGKGDRVPVGGYVLAKEPIEINVGRPRLKVKVRNTGDRPIQVGSHYHFFEVNRALEFDRPAALGMRLDVPSGQSIRFEAGDERDVELVELGGTGRVIGFNDLMDGATSSVWTTRRALDRVRELGFRSTAESQERES
jgi:urease beta subunit